MLLIPDQRALAGKLYTDIPAHKESWFYKLISKTLSNLSRTN